MKKVMIKIINNKENKIKEKALLKNYLNEQLFY